MWLYNCVLLILLLSFHETCAQFPEDDILDSGGNNFFSNLFWNQNAANNIIQENRAPCFTNLDGARASRREGTCMARHTCAYNKGKATSRSTCGFLNTCCVFEKTSNQTSDARVTYFINPNNPRTLPQDQRLYVKLANKNVCQMRVDIISMTLATSIYDKTAKTRVCDKDNFSIEPKQTENRIPQICGKNTDQHFYVHLTSDLKVNNAVIFNVHLDPGTDTGSGTGTVTALPAPQWEIKITQLECPSRHKHFEATPKENRNQVAEDFSRLAPPGCLQYFTEPSGSFKNFNHGSATDTNVNTNQDYAICFKHFNGICGVTLEPKVLLFRSKEAMMCMDEYIYVPEPTVPATAPAIAERKCEMPKAADPKTYISKHPGPLYVHVFLAAMAKGDEMPPAQDNMYGFFFNYKLNVEC